MSERQGHLQLCPSGTLPVRIALEGGGFADEAGVPLAEDLRLVGWTLISLLTPMMRLSRCKERDASFDDNSLVPGIGGNRVGLFSLDSLRGTEWTGRARALFHGGARAARHGGSHSEVQKRRLVDNYNMWYYGKHL